MTYLSLVFCLFVFSFYQPCKIYSNENLTHDEIIEFDRDLRQDGNQVIAKVFNFYLDSNVHRRENFTKILTYKAVEDKDGKLNIYQIGWYADGYTITYLNGQTTGKQIVVWQDHVVGISYPQEKYNGDPGTLISHSYSWGRVYTRYDFQEIVLNETDAPPFVTFVAAEP